MQLDQRKLYYDNYNAWFYKYGKSLYKIYKNYVSERLEAQVLYNRLIKEDVNENIILPTELLYNQKHYLTGYKMNFVNGTILSEEIKKAKMSFEDKIFLINEFFSLLEQVHDYLVVGDVRNSNLMVGKDKQAYMIDFDFAKKADSSATPLCRYHICHNDEYLNDRNEDVIKLYISALSLLYNYNVEHAFANIEEIDALEMFVPLSGFLKDYYHYILDCVYKHKNIDNYLKIPFDSCVEGEVNSKKARILNK